MDHHEFQTQQFLSLRAEIQARQTRQFLTVIVGLLGMPLMTYVAMSAETLLSLTLPLFVLVVIVLFLSEQNAMMRAGRYIREHIEPGLGHRNGWEAWLESKGELRLMERHFFACFITMFFIFYFLSIGVAASDLWIRAVEDTSGHYWYWFYGALVSYGLSTLWVLSTLVHHWKSSVSTSPEEPGSRGGSPA